MPTDPSLTALLREARAMLASPATLSDDAKGRCLHLLDQAEGITRRKKRGKRQPEMDAARDRARPALEAARETWTVQDLAEWWGTWHQTAGHRRLGRLLMHVTGVKLDRELPSDVGAPLDL
jgi:hypothetical protein